MNSSFPHALSPLRINGFLFKNRILAAPSTIHSASAGELYPNEEAMAFFESRAKTGAAVVYCAGVKQADLFDDGEHTCWDAAAYNHKNKLAQLAERIHAHGALAGMEVMGLLPTSWRPGPLTCSDGNRVMLSPPIGIEITKEEMERYKQATAALCANLLCCGYDSLLFHFGHSIPAAQFLSPLTNRRTDEYGGSLENRTRYPVEILDACRAATGGRMTMEVRMSASEFEEGGITLEEGISIAEILQEHCDIIQASCGMVTPKYMTYTHPCAHLPPHPNLWLAEAFKKSGRIHKPVTAIGAFESLAAAEEAIAAGKCDFVAISRAFIADPELVKKALAGCPDEVTPCIKCMRCHDSAVYEHQFHCSVNPQVGIEACLQNMWPQTPKTKKRVAVIGGGPAGMKAALVACGRGHEVTLFEKSGSLGGALHFSDFVSFKYALRNYKDYLVKQVLNQPAIQLRLNTEATPELLGAAFDAVLIAIGASPLLLPIPGFCAENGLFAQEVYGQEEKIGKSALIIGGGQVGCETALHLTEKGIQVTIVEMRETLCPDASPTCGDELRILLAENSLFTALCGARCTEIQKGKATCLTFDGQVRTLTADTLIYAAGMKARTQEADLLIPKGAAQWAEIGDCVRARTVEQATREAFYAAMEL